MWIVQSDGTAKAGAFEVTDYGIALEPPFGWLHDDKDSFGFVLYDPQSLNKKRKIRIHFPGGEARSPKEQVKTSLDSINKRRDGKCALERIRYEKPVTTRSGMEGCMAAHGFEGEADRPSLNHYYFRIPSGRIICVCAYLSGADEETEARMEQMILNTLRLLSPNQSRQRRAMSEDGAPAPSGIP